MRSLALAFALLAPPALGQTTWYVDVTGNPPGTGTANDPYTSIQYAIDQPTTLDGDTLLVAAGTYLEAVSFQGKALLIDGSGALPHPTIDAGGATSAVTFANGEGPGSVLRGFRVSGGAGTPVALGVAGGGVLVVAAAPTLEDVALRGNGAELGGGLAAISGAAPVLVGCAVEGNTAETGGGLYAESSTIELHECAVRSNVADHPSAPGYGGGAWIGAGAKLVAHDVLFEGNRAVHSGGGGALRVEAGGKATVTDCELRDNRPGAWAGPGSGGAIDAQGEVVALSCRFERNGGVGDAVDGVLYGGAARGGTYRKCVFVDNVAQYGGALYGATAVDCNMEGNLAGADQNGYGGGAHSCTLVRCTLIGNTAWGDGGGASSSVLTDCTVLYNSATGAYSAVPGLGGGIEKGSATGSVLHGNMAVAAQGGPSEGGGAFNAPLERCVLTGNVADRGAGASFHGTPAADALRHCTLLANHAELSAGGLYFGSGKGVVVSSILWGNLPDAIVDAGGTLAVDWSCVEGGYAGTGNFALDPQVFGPAGSDAHLLAGSPCIDAGDPAAPNDPDGTRADVGALPFDAAWSGGASRYCVPTVTWTGCLPLANAAGSPSLSGPDDFVVTAADVPPGRLGLLFHGAAPAATPASGGVLCIGGPLARFAPQTSQPGPAPCGGSFAQPVSQATLAALGLAPGDRLYLQWWFRQETAGFVAFTDGIEAVVQP